MKALKRLHRAFRLHGAEVPKSEGYPGSLFLADTAAGAKNEGDNKKQSTISLYIQHSIISS